MRETEFIENNEGAGSLGTPTNNPSAKLVYFVVMEHLRQQSSGTGPVSGAVMVVSSGAAC